MRTRGPLIAAILVGGALNWPRLPEPLAADAPEAEFSAERAVAPLAEWAREPRPAGSAAHARVVASLEVALRERGFEVVGEAPPGSRLHNLVASAPGAGPDGVWLTAHTDSVRGAPGAADDGLGLAVVLEVTRALAMGGPPPGLHVLFTDGEEAGLLGAEAHLALLGERAAAERRLVLNVEARGTEGPAYMFQTSGPEPALLAAWRESGCRAQATSLAHTIYELLPNDTDFTVFRRPGWWGYDFALIGGAWRYHTPDDTPANLSAGSVQAVGDCVLGLAKSWLARPIGDERGGASAEARAYAQLGPATLTASPWAVRLVALAALGVLRRPGRILAGAGAWTVALGLAGVLGACALAAAVFAWPGFVVAPAESLNPEPLFGVAVALALGAGLASLRLFRRFSPERPWLEVASLAAIAAVVVLPTAAYPFVPGAWAAALRARGHERAATVAALLSGALVAPVLLGAYLGLTTRMLPVLVLLPLLTLGWCLPGRGGDPER